MRLSNQISPHSLIPENEYLIAMNWNETNDLRFEPEYILRGKFLRLEYIKGRTYSYDTGLQILTNPSRINLLFDIHGMRCKISSANLFYEIHKPTEEELSSEYAIRTTRLPKEILNIIRVKL